MAWQGEARASKKKGKRVATRHRRLEGHLEVTRGSSVGCRGHDTHSTANETNTNSCLTWHLGLGAGVRRAAVLRFGSSAITAVVAARQRRRRRRNVRYRPSCPGCSAGSS